MKVRISITATLCVCCLAAAGCGVTGGHNLPPAQRLAQPGPGVGGPGPGVLRAPSMVVPRQTDVGIMNPQLAANGTTQMAAGMASAIPNRSGVVQASYSDPGRLDGGVVTTVGAQAQVLFARPGSMQVRWDVTGSGQFDSTPLVAPGRYNFEQGGIYRLKLTHIPGREGVELYPTLEVGPATRRTAAYLAHNAVPVQFTEEDLDQVVSDNFVTKVIYLPDPEFQQLALAGVETLVSTRLEPGKDPVVEADRRGAILAIIRLGNKDLEMPGGLYQDGEVIQAGFSHLLDGGCGSSSCGLGGCGGSGCGLGHSSRIGNGGCPIQNVGEPYGPGGMPAALVSAVTPQYGMPITGTPIGLPGPPHIPLGSPAGLKKHIMRNHTKRHIPAPNQKVAIHVRQRPGQSYPQPANKVWITEDTIHPSVHYGYQKFGAPPTGHVHFTGAGCNGINCGPNR